MSQGAWTALSGTQIGSVHVRDGRPIQDAVRTWVEGDSAVVAVADGHGHHEHFRSDVGARLAVDAAVDALVGGLPDLADAGGGPARDHRHCRPRRAGVDRRVCGSTRPRTPSRVAPPAMRCGPTAPRCWRWRRSATPSRCSRSATATRSWSTARATPPARCPEDPDAGRRHHRLALPAEPAQVAAGRRPRHPCRATSYWPSSAPTASGPRASTPSGWWQQTGEELVRFGREHGLGWVAEQLPGWLVEPAQVGGDDTTLAILSRTDLPGRAPATV